ncbi:MAG TPA: hypothetical protein VHY91_24455 [Pirellulales bacterium]|jgi:hypothetical protein|nr:hypothetical protein [Pirellulales bacterium]
MKRLFLVLVCCVFTGCGTGYYDDLYRQHLDELKRAEQFVVLTPEPSEVPGTNLVVRLPKIFDRSYNKNSIYSLDTSGEIDPNRLNPPFLNPFPGLVNCYEAFVKDSAGENLPIYLYTGFRDLPSEGKAALEQELFGKLKALAPTVTLDTVEALTPQGAKVPWKKMSAAMPQDFFPWGQGSGNAKQMPGVFELWLYSPEADPLAKQEAVPTGLVLFAWRAPETIAGQVNLSGLATLTAGTLAVKPPEAKPAEPAAPPAEAAPADAQNAPAP